MPRRFFLPLIMALTLVGPLFTHAATEAFPAQQEALAEQADAFFKSGQTAQARQAYTQLVRNFQQSGVTDQAYAEALFNLGVTCEKTDDLGAADLAFRQSLATFENLFQQDTQETALALEGLAAVLLRQENDQEATIYLERALAVRQELFGPNHPQLGRLYALRALASQLSGDWESTEEWYYRALTAYRRIHGNAHPYVAQIIQNIGTFYADTGFFQAEIMFQQAADVTEMLSGPWHPLRAASLTNFGRLRWMEGDYQASEDHLREALAIHDHLGAYATPDRGMCLYHLGRTLLAQNRHRDAERVLAEAAEIYEVNWWRSGSGAERSLANRSPYALLAVARLKANDNEGALQAFAAYQGRLAALAKRLRELPFELAVKRDSLVTALDQGERRLANFEAPDAQTDTPQWRQGRALARADLAVAEAHWTDFQQELPRDREQVMRSVAEVTARMQAGEAAIGWLDVEIRPAEFVSWAFVLRADRPLDWIALPQSGTTTESPLLRTRTALAEIQDPTLDTWPTVAQLRQSHVSPLTDALVGTDRWIVIPSGAMAGFPVNLLIVQDKELTYTFNLDSLQWPAATAHRSRDDIRVLAVADPVFSNNQPTGEQTSVSQSLPAANVLRSALNGNRAAINQLPRLAGTRLEANALSSLYSQTTVLLGEQASEQALRSLAEDNTLAEFDIIHLATHALIDAEKPGASALVLSQDVNPGGTDGLLTVREISHSWRLNAELVTLSACATGLGRRIDGEGFVGFSQTLMGVGARNIMVSLWPVDDRATALFMEKFYTLLAGETVSHLSPSQALRQSRQWLRDYTTPTGSQPFAAPRYWAGFIMFSFDAKN